MELPCKREVSESEEKVQKHQKVDETNPEELKSSNSMYGFLAFDVPDTYELTEIGLKKKIKCDQVFILQHRKKHRRIFAAFYASQEKRNVQLFAPTKLKNVSLVKLAIEPNEGSEKEILKKFTNKLKEAYQFFMSHPAKGKQIEEKTQELKELVKELCAGVMWAIKKSYDRFASSLDPERDDHFWFLICEFICYAQYKIIDDGPSTENLHVLRVFANELTIDRFRSLKRNDMNFVFDSLFQCLFYKYENNNGDWLSLSARILVDINSDAKKFTDLSYIDRILQILLTSKVQMVFQSYMQSEPYEEFANKLINSCYLYLLPKEVNGKTLYNSSIILNSINHFEEEKEIIGFIAVVFLHEMGHVAVRSSFKTALQSLEFNSEEDIELPNNSSQSSNEEKESGYRVEEIIFGKKLKKLNSLAAEYLGDSKNWNSEDFQIKFKELNSMKIDSEGKKIKFVRMKKGNDVGFLNLDYNWCGTTRLRNIR